jgi:hypothetical protein
MQMVTQIVDELKTLFGNDVWILPVHGITVDGYEVECFSYSKFPLFEHIMRRYQKTLDNPKIKVLYTECGNFLILNIGEPLTPTEFVKELRNYYQPHDKVCELKEDENHIFVIIKPHDNLHDYLLRYDLENCGFEIIDDDLPFIIAVARKNVS